MTDPDDAPPPAEPVVPASTDATADVPPGTSDDDRATRRAALRDLAAMIGLEVFY